MSVPSREFAIQQSVLNAAAKRMPATVKNVGAANALKWICFGPIDALIPSIDFVEEIRSEYRQIMSRYQERNAA